MVPATLLWLLSLHPAPASATPSATVPAAPAGPVSTAPAVIVPGGSSAAAPVAAAVAPARAVCGAGAAGSGSGSQQGSRAPDYPVDDLGIPCTRPACGRFVLVDAAYSLSRATGTDMAGSVRLRASDRAFIGLEAGDVRRALFVTTTRLDLGWRNQDGAHAIEGEWRAPRFRLGGSLERRSGDDGGGWGGELRGALRLGDDFEVLARAGAAQQPRPGDEIAIVPPAQLRVAALGLLWQRGTGLDVLAEVSTGRIRAPAGIELDRDRVTGAVTWYRPGVEVQAELAWERDRGVLPSEEALAIVGADVEFARHFVGHVEVLNRWQPGLKKIERDIAGGVTFFGRRHRFERGGDAARRTLELVRRARRLGYNERRDHSIDGRRGLRERLSISDHGGELADDIEALYRAQVEERNVPQLAIELSRRRDDLADVTSRSVAVFVGLPWAPAWPWSRGEDAVRFLTLGYSRTDNEVTPALSTTERRLRVELELNREAAVSLEWIEPAPTPIQVATRDGQPRRFELGLVWSLGR